MKWLLTALLLACALAFGVLLSAQPPQTGRATEKRFPPLKVPPGFKATLFACDPLIEYPSVIATGPRPGAIFVAFDYMTGLGSDGKVKSEVRLIEDTDGDGYADKSTTVAGGFNSIQGLAYHDGAVLVMHAPFLTSIRGKERKDLLSGLGLKPEDNASRLHCANGVVAGHDGWLYLALGDNGVNVPRPEGDRLIHNGGAILRCRPDGRDLHVFSTGLRNIYDIALDAELNVFTRDNENDGGTYMIRVCHSFFGADHGYPYDYYERPTHALKPIGDFGLGSSAGGVCYLETQFPREYRGNLFFCEWGKSVVRYPLARSGGGFAPVKEIDFAAGDPKDKYPFKPTDAVVQRDGTLMVSDYADGQRPKRGRGRIYRITFDGPGQKKGPPTLSSEGYFDRCEAQAAIELSGKAPALAKMEARGRMHAVWALAKIDGVKALDALFAIAANDADPGVRVQAIRAIADLTDPILVKHKLDAGRGEVQHALRLAGLDAKKDARVLLEVILALGRLRWKDAQQWLQRQPIAGDDALEHAAMQTLRRADNWPEVLASLDQPAGYLRRPGPLSIAVRALADQYEPVIVDGVIERLAKEESAAQRAAYAEVLARAFKKPGPWKYWGYRPGPRPANTVHWERTDAIEKALNVHIADALKAMRREKVPVSAESLIACFKNETNREREAMLLTALAEHPAKEAREQLYAAVINKQRHPTNRVLALDFYLKNAGPAMRDELLRAAADLDADNTPVIAEVLRRLARESNAAPMEVFAKRLASAEPVVRAAALDGLGAIRAANLEKHVLAGLKDADVHVRRAAAGAAGKLQIEAATEQLIKLAGGHDVETRLGCLDSLRRLRDPRVVPLAVAALNESALEGVALQCLEELGSHGFLKELTAFGKRNPSTQSVEGAVRVLAAWREGTSGDVRAALNRAIAEIQGSSGMLVEWKIDRFSKPLTLFAVGAESRLMLPPKAAKSAWCDVIVPQKIEVEFLASSRGSFEVSLNAKRVFQRAKPGKFQVDADRFEGTFLETGVNRIRVDTGISDGIAEFHLRFRRKSSKAEHEKLTQFALSRPGNAERGKRIFHDREKSQCMKCHQMAGEGERIGPELTGVGSRFSRIHLIESILEPSRTIAPSFGTYAVELKTGKTLSGVKLSETETTLTLADNQGVKHALARADIESAMLAALSTMPEGLEQRMTQDEFVDLIAYLVSQKDTQRR